MNIKNFFLVAFAMASFAVNAQETIIKTTELPAAAVQFLATHFKDNAVSRAVKDAEILKMTYEVTLADGTEVEFSKKGDWKEVDGKHKAIPTAFIPKEIVDYVKTNYPKEQITHIDKDNNYDVDLSNGIDLEFNMAGKFLRIDD